MWVGGQEQHRTLLIKDTSSSIHHCPLTFNTMQSPDFPLSHWMFALKLQLVLFSAFSVLQCPKPQSWHFIFLYLHSAPRSSSNSISLTGMYMLMTLHLSFNFIFCLSSVFSNIDSNHQYFAPITPTLIKSYHCSSGLYRLLTGKLDLTPVTYPYGPTLYTLP